MQLVSNNKTGHAPSLFTNETRVATENAGTNQSEHRT